MKHTIRLLCIGMAMMCCLFGCNQKTDAAQTNPSEQVDPITLTADSFSAMHLSLSEAGLLGDNAVIWTPSVEINKEFVDASVATQVTIPIQDDSCVVKYRVSDISPYGDQRNEYYSDDEQVKAVYQNKSCDLSALYVHGSQIDVNQDWTTEKEYLDWAKKLLIVYGVKDLSGYEYSCRTHTKVWGDDWAGHEHYDYFYTIKDPSCERVRAYYFTFSKTIDGFNVSDEIQVWVRFDSDGTHDVCITFDEGQFDNVTEIKLDRAKMEKTLDEYVRGCINTEKYNLHSYEITNQVLTYKDGKLCNVYTVEVNFTPLSAPNSEPYSSLETIGVFCE